MQSRSQKNQCLGILLALVSCQNDPELMNKRSPAEPKISSQETASDEADAERHKKEIPVDVLSAAPVPKDQGSLRNAELTCSLNFAQNPVTRGQQVEASVIANFPLSAVVIDGQAVDAALKKKIVSAESTKDIYASVTDVLGRSVGCRSNLSIKYLPIKCDLLANSTDVFYKDAVELTLIPTGDIRSAKIGNSTVPTTGGKKTQIILASETFTAEVTGYDGSQSTCAASVSVKFRPTTCSLMSNVSSINAGGNATLTLNYTGDVFTATIDGENVSASGKSIVKAPAATTTYSAVINGRDLTTKTCTTTIKVNTVQLNTLSFNLNSASKKIDMIWVIDSSPSMSGEISKVAMEFSNFITSVQGITDLKLGLITNSTLIKLPLGSNFFHLNAYVFSNDAIAIAMAASCNEKSIALNQGSNSSAEICGKIYSSNNGDFTIGNYNYFYTSGLNIAAKELLSFPRNDAQRIYVFVSDDDSYPGPANDFVEKIKQTNQGNAPRVFGFVGLPDSVQGNGCRIDHIGKAYQKIATETGGKTYDLCATSWSPHFSDLTQTIKEIVNTEFDIPLSAKSIVSVKLDGVELNSSQYVFSPGKLIIQKSAVNAQSKNVVIVYLN